MSHGFRRTKRLSNRDIGKLNARPVVQAREVAAKTLEIAAAANGRDCETQGGARGQKAQGG
jgi:hypothetical protein